VMVQTWKLQPLHSRPARGDANSPGDQQSARRRD
jgi:hypothetical protein